ncbi:MAG: alanine racemase [Deltaproteobacteria bacterium]|nr:alanine racemase [Deltaproteobacteria bacterium]
MLKLQQVSDFNVATIDLSALKNNFKIIQNYRPTRPLMPVIKGDAYGHGLVECAKALVEAGATSFGVLDVLEGARLREAGITREAIFVLSGMDSGWQINQAIEHRLSAFVYSLQQLATFGLLVPNNAPSVDVFLKIDTGMSRLGASVYQAEDLFKKARIMNSVNVVGVATHLATLGDGHALKQLEAFWKIASLAENLLGDKLVNSALSGGACLAHPDYPDGISRPGLVLYGVQPQLGKEPLPHFPPPWPRQEDPLAFRRLPGSANSGLPVTPSWTAKALEVMKLLKPVMRVRSRIIQVKDIRRGDCVSYGREYQAKTALKIGVIPMGYLNGLHVDRSNRLQAIVQGQLVPQIGRICMNLSVFDLSEVGSRVSVGDEVVILGSQGKNVLDAFQEFQGQKQNPYETLCLLGRLNQRRYD